MKIIVILVLCVIALSFVYRKEISTKVAGHSFNVKEDYTIDKEEMFKSDVSVVKTWNLPPVLREVSGIAYLDDTHFACIQDEVGSIFIFNTSTKTIEREVRFAAPGDFEGLTMVKNTAYVVRADGTLFEIDNINNAKPVVKQFVTHLTVAQNIEGLCFDVKNNRLLLSVKDDEPGNKNYKGIYAFDLNQKMLAKEPVIKIFESDSKFKKGKGKKKVHPSALGIHPIEQELYVVDGPGARVFTINAKSEVGEVYDLGKDFVKAEGITFSKNGNMFISNEGKGNPGNIKHVQLKN